MAQTFDEAVRTVRLYVGTAPVFLVRDWVNQAYKELAESRNWSFLRGELDLIILAARSLAAVGVTLGSTTVTSAGLFLAADQGRQFAIGSFPVYTIQAVTDVNTITLDRPYAGDTNAAAAGKVFDGFATMPADFGSFRLIADPYTRRRLPFWIHEDELNLLDAARDSTDSGPRCLVARAPSTYTQTLGRLQYEYWPQPTSARSYPALYNKQAASLDDTSVFRGVLADAGQLLVTGALAHAAQWPGTADLRNPYFNVALAASKRDQFLTGVQTLALKDDNQYPDDLAHVSWSRWPLADIAMNDVGLRASDATVAEMWG